MNAFINYKDYKIELPNPKDEKSHTALIYNSAGSLIKCIAGDIYADGSNNREDKAKRFVDALEWWSRLEMKLKVIQFTFMFGDKRDINTVTGNEILLMYTDNNF